MGSLLAALGLGGTAAAGTGTAAAASPFITQAAASPAAVYATGADAAAVPLATAPVPAASASPGIFSQAAQLANKSPGFLQGTGINYGQLAQAAMSKGNAQDFAPMWNAYMQAQDAAFKNSMQGLGMSDSVSKRDQAAANKLASDLGFTSSGVTTPQVGNAPGLTQFQ